MVFLIPFNFIVPIGTINYGGLLKMFAWIPAVALSAEGTFVTSAYTSGSAVSDTPVLRRVRPMFCSPSIVFRLELWIVPH
jgi:hypothetical protein